MNYIISQHNRFVSYGCDLLILFQLQIYYTKAKESQVHIGSDRCLDYLKLFFLYFFFILAYISNRFLYCSRNFLYFTLNGSFYINQNSSINYSQVITCFNLGILLLLFFSFCYFIYFYVLLYKNIFFYFSFFSYKSFFFSPKNFSAEQL